MSENQNTTNAPDVGAAEPTTAPDATEPAATEPTATDEATAEEAAAFQQPVEGDGAPAEPGSTEDADIVIEVPTRVFAKGTKLTFGSETVELVEDATFTYPNAGNEQHFAATCQLTGNYDVNADRLENKYDLNGVVVVPDED